LGRIFTGSYSLPPLSSRHLILHQLLQERTAHQGAEGQLQQERTALADARSALERERTAREATQKSLEGRNAEFLRLEGELVALSITSADQEQSLKEQSATVVSL
jgi:hypothetical protein